MNIYDISRLSAMAGFEIVIVAAMIADIWAGRKIDDRVILALISALAAMYTSTL